MKDLNTNLLRFHQREQIASEITQSEEMLVHAKTEERAAISSSLRKSRKQLNDHSPEPLTTKEKDTLHTLEKKLRARITENMLSEESMRKNPAGAVDYQTKWEKHNKKAIRMWKNIRIQLNPDNTDRDLANIERYRPAGALQHGLRTDAQIPGVMTYGNVQQEDWDDIFTPPQNTALEQAKRRYDEDNAQNEVNGLLEELDEEEAKEAIAEDEPKAKRELTAEERAVLVNRLAEARKIKAAKLEEERKLDETLAALPAAKAS